MATQVQIVPGYPRQCIRDLRRCLLQLAEIASDKAKALVPVDTGALRDSINVEVSGNAVTVGSELDYSFWVEYGTRFQPAQPFLRPTLLHLKRLTTPVKPNA